MANETPILVGVFFGDLSTAQPMGLPSPQGYFRCIIRKIDVSETKGTGGAEKKPALNFASMIDPSEKGANGQPAVGTFHSTVVTPRNLDDDKNGFWKNVMLTILMSAFGKTDAEIRSKNWGSYNMQGLVGKPIYIANIPEGNEGKLNTRIITRDAYLDGKKAGAGIQGDINDPFKDTATVTQTQAKAAAQVQTPPPVQQRVPPSEVDPFDSIG